MYTLIASLKKVTNSRIVTEVQQQHNTRFWVRREREKGKLNGVLGKC
jgi:hypothetical protein